jgi:hypothetical protein
MDFNCKSAIRNPQSAIKKRGDLTIEAAFSRNQNQCRNIVETARRAVSTDKLPGFWLLISSFRARQEIDASEYREKGVANRA